MNNHQLDFHPERPGLHPSEHHGRDHIAQHAFGRLGTEDVQSFAIIGFLREGKTSFMNYLRHPQVVKKYLGAAASRYIFLYLDLSKPPLNDEAAFFKEFYKDIEKLLPLSNLRDLLDLNKITDCLNTYNQRLIIILDNFNLIVTNPNFRVAFYEGLRSWFSTHTQVGCVVTSPVQLLHLSIPQELAGSPFFNIFDAYLLSPLTLTEATQLIYQRLPELLREREKDIFNLITQVGYSPYPLQRAGQIWVSNYTVEKDPAFTAVLDEVYQACVPYYQDIYSSLRNNQLDSIASLLDSSRKTQGRIDNSLVDRGWVTKDRRRISARLLERFLRDRLGISEKKNPFKQLKRFLTGVWER